jgi:hypothetical protein
MPHVVVSDLKIYKNMLIAATHARSLYALDVSDIQAAINANVAQEANTRTVSAYPNPAGSTFSIDGYEGSVTSCRFIDLESGRQFARTIRSTDISTEGIPSGSYTVELLRDTRVIARTKLTIVK